jgi:hypothetical protein
MSTLQERFHDWLSNNADEVILRWIFRSLITVIVGALAADLAGANGWIAPPNPAVPAEIRRDVPSLDLPSVVPSILAPLLPGGDKRLTPLPQPKGALAKPMTFELRQVDGKRHHYAGNLTGLCRRIRQAG